MSIVHADALDAALDLHPDGRNPDDWVAGVTDDPRRRLRELAVDLDNGAYAFVECIDAGTAAAASSYLHDWGYNGRKERSRDDGRVYVYVYAITDDTCEDRGSRPGSSSRACRRSS